MQTSQTNIPNSDFYFDYLIKYNDEEHLQKLKKIDAVIPQLINAYKQIELISPLRTHERNITDLKLSNISNIPERIQTLKESQKRFIITAIVATIIGALALAGIVALGITIAPPFMVGIGPILGIFSFFVGYTLGKVLEEKQVLEEDRDNLNKLLMDVVTINSQKDKIKTIIGEELNDEKTTPERKKILENMQTELEAIKEFIEQLDNNVQEMRANRQQKVS